MPFYRIYVGYGIANTACAAILANGIPSSIYSTPVRVINVISSLNQTIFEIEASDTTIANAWSKALPEAIKTVVEYTPVPGEDPDPPPSALNVFSKVGTWTKTAGNATTVITGLGGQPKALFVWGSGLIGQTSFGSYADNGGFVFGFSDGTTHRCMAHSIRDNVGTSETYRFRSNKLFSLIDPTQTQSNMPRDKANTTFQSDGFTLHWDDTTNAAVGHYMAIWGTDIINIAIKDFDTGTTSKVIQDYDLDLGWTPDFGLFLYSPGMNGVALPGTDSDAAPTISVNAGQSNLSNWFISAHDQHNQATTNSSRIKKYGKVMGAVFQTDEFQTARFNEWTSEGFKIDWTSANPLFSNDPFACILIKGGRWDAGYFIQPTTGGTSPTGDVVSLLSSSYAKPKAIMTFTDGNIATESDIGNTHARFAVGATDGTTQGVTSMSSEHGADTSVVSTIMYNTKLMSTTTPAATASSSTENASCTIQSMATDGQFTVHFGASDGTQRQTLWFSLSA